MREILFRGKNSKCSDRWCEGFLVKTGNRFSILTQNNPIAFEVYPETIGQYTGLKDKNGKRIFEGDIVEMSTGKIGAVVYDEGCAGYGLKGLGDGCCLCVSTESERLVIGNIHDNPDLLRGTGA